MSTSMIPADVTAVLQGFAYAIRDNTGVLCLGGDDRLAFLDRQTTNALKTLSPGRLVPTVLTSPTARILDFMHVFSRGDDLLVLTLPGHGMSSARFLQGKIFFMDKVSVQEQTAEWLLIELLGPQAGRIASLLDLKHVDPQSVHRVQHAAAAEAWLLRGRGLGIGDHALLVPRATATAWQTMLQQAGAVAVRPENYEILRIAEAVPGAGTELTPDYTPLEANLRYAIAENKGCYTGQEIIARQITYDKVTKTLQGLRLPAVVPPGSQLYAGEQAAGLITSVATSPRCGGIALAYVRRPFAQRGSELSVKLADHNIVATVVTPPCPIDP